jgi:hypothetical protein
MPVACFPLELSGKGIAMTIGSRLFAPAAALLDGARVR